MQAPERQEEGQAQAGNPRSDDEQTSSPTFAKQMKPWFVTLLALEALFLIIRWKAGDAHGALLMFAVCSVGLLALLLGNTGIDAIYGGYFGLMAFVSGLLDLNLAIEHLVWFEWKQWRHEAFTKGDVSAIIRPALYLACAFLQLASAFIAYLIYKEAEYLDEFAENQDETAPFFASSEQARIYSAAMRYGERPRPSASGDPLKPFVGTAHKLA